ncbi:MAG: non-canonical purine NTP pyrophosphatase [Spirochaetales bacterium]|nr:non-canonical purine NTP pyrophosphatase [Spirochaetales bacterium]
MDILLATGNAHKKMELDRILYPHRMILPKELGITYEAIENGSTYLENAFIKARALRKAAKAQGVTLPVLADDSGLSVPALQGAPGVYSARYGSQEGGPELASEERNALLLSNMNHLEGLDREAFFVCCMVLILEDYREFTVQETFPGRIATSPAGCGGFGYDPIFFLEQEAVTVAELQDEEKDKRSHRGLAGQRIHALLESLA